MNTLLDHFRCPICGGPIQGRSDKRYCSQKCKNTHHYLARRNCKPLIVEKNKRLERNFVILEGLIQQWHPVLKIHKSVLIKLGFDFNSVTRFDKQENFMVSYCYHFRYTVDLNEIVTVMKIEEVDNMMPGFFERWEMDYPRDMQVGKQGGNLSVNDEN